MDFERWLRIATRHRTILVLVALLSTFAGADLLLNRPKGTGTQWLAVPLLACGAALFVWTAWPKGVRPAGAQPTLAARFLHLVTWRGRLIPYFPILGTAIVVADLVYNAALSATPSLLTEDTIVLLGAGALISYGFVPIRFMKERDFVLVFFIMLNAVLVVPLLIARAFYADFERSVDVYSWVALAPETSAVLSLLGVSNNVHAISGSAAPGLTFAPQKLSIQVTIVITTACSGIYSFGIFASAFVAFVLTEYERSSPWMWALLGLGFLAAYAANVLRMVAIVLVGYFTDTPGTDLQNMLVAHSYAGWIIFLGWLALFWGVLLKFLPLERSPQVALKSTKETMQQGIPCVSCQALLTPAISAIRCTCGAYYHMACALEARRCLRCERPVRAVSTSAYRVSEVP